ncbi:integral membrane protein [Hypoxylon sp. NC1633]|nr:integral membrane protein [Hypoxylon sp. NC1633]
MVSQPDAVAQGFPRQLYIVFGSFFGIACYNSIEIYFIAFNTFQRKNSVYFWSLLVANTGILVHEISATLRLFTILPNMVMVPLESLGWWMTTTGQSAVLYSRLHLVVANPCKLRWILFMYIFTIITLQVPTTILHIGENAIPTQSDSRTKAFNFFKNAQLAAFMIDEAIISGVYVCAFYTTSKPMRMIKEDRVRTVLRQLVGLLILIVTLDITLVVVELCGFVQVQTTLKPVVYSIKLKGELFVLDNLINLVQLPTSSCWNSAVNRNSYADQQANMPKPNERWVHNTSLPERCEERDTGTFSTGIFDGTT